MNASTLHRRAVLGTALAALAGGGAAKADASPPFVLVHGAWHGAWCWQRLTPLLAARGHWSYAPTLSGCGERTAEIGPHITLDTHIDEIVQLLYAHDLRDVVLVGHSYAGAVISGVADRVPQLLRRLVYLDAVIPE
ncbi:MAG: alpha/beta fold hydrolase, partial [Rhodospirillales bacterium]|nr:alpha/beta fold hydrolase [Rhodospirillales bacterium]